MKIIGIVFILFSIGMVAQDLPREGNKESDQKPNPRIRQYEQQNDLLVIDTPANIPNQVITNAQSNLASIGRPLVFVHGCGGIYSDWYPIANAINSAAIRDLPSLYNSNSMYVVLFDGNNVRYFDASTGNEINVSQIGQNARIFIVAFYDPTQSDLTDGLNPAKVVNISVIYKAAELSKILAAIQDITFVEDSIVVAHSMGGTVSRMYIEGLGGSLEHTPTQNTYFPGQVTFQNNLGSLITLDSPHSGAQWTLFESIFSDLLPCTGLNRDEIDPTNSEQVIPTLNYVSGNTLGGFTALPISQNIQIRSIKSYQTNLTVAHDGGYEISDGALTDVTQDIRQALQGNFLLTNNLTAIENSFGTTWLPDSACYTADLIYLLHPLACVGVQQSSLQYMYNGIFADHSGNALGVNALSFSNSTVVGQTPVSATIQLTSPSPANGAIVILSTNNSAAIIPNSVSIPPGNTQANFTISTTQVATQQSATITASYGRLNQMTVLTITPAAPIVSLTSSNLSFGNTLLGLSSTGQQIVLTNTGSAALNISSISISGDFAQSNNCPNTLAQNANCSINIVFSPTAFGPRTGTLTIADNAAGAPHQVNLSGQGFDIVISNTRPTRGHPPGWNNGATSTQISDYELTLALQAPSGMDSSALPEIVFECTNLPVGATCSIQPSGAKISLNPITIKVDVMATLSRRSYRLTQNSKNDTGTLPGNYTIKLVAHIGKSVRSIDLPFTVQ